VKDHVFHWKHGWIPVDSSGNVQQRSADKIAARFHAEHGTPGTQGYAFGRRAEHRALDTYLGWYRRRTQHLG